MMRCRKFIITVIITFFILTATDAQNTFFRQEDEKEISGTNSYRKISPGKYNIRSINNVALRNFLWSLPSEQNLTNRNEAPLLSLPMPDGSIARFHVWESTIMEPVLAARFPDIRTFAGQGIDDPYATVRLDYNPSFGFSGQILSVNGDVYIDPYSSTNTNYCISYYSGDYKKDSPFDCKVISDTAGTNRPAFLSRGYCRGAQLFTFRLALACTGEYATAVCSPNLPSASATMAAMVTSINRVNGIYEKELAMRFLLVASNNLLVFLNPATDPYTTGNAQAMLNENQVVTDNLIGFTNYDMGHLLSNGSSSLSSFYSVCNSTNKAKGMSGLANPSGDPFDVDRVAHNFGHLFGANDTHNSTDASCTGGPALVGIEPGSGTSIMACAGTCGPDNLQPGNDPFFHAFSFNAITEGLQGPVGACRGIINTGNTVPRILAMNNNGAYIPVNTPFTLNAVAMDDDGDAITYCWDEMDNGVAGSWNSSASSLTRPLFKSRIPKTTGSRTFPDIEVILAGYPANPPPVQNGLKGETLPAVSRVIKFGLTVRDNRAGGGGVVNDDNDCANQLFPFEIYSVAAAGPFTVRLPDGGETWSAGSSQTILWNVAGTDVPPVSTALVNILLSTDGGYTYPFVLAGNVPNDGFEVVTLPNISAGTARIKIEAVGNIFFDISNADFSIAINPTGFEFSNPSMVTLTCPAPAAVSFSLGTISNSGYATGISLSAPGLPTGLTISFGTNPVQPGSSSTVTLNNVNTLSQGLYYITVTGISGSLTRSRILVLNVQSGPLPVITSQPADQTDCEGSNITFTVVSPSATGYQWQKSTDGGFSFADIILNGNGPSYTIVNAGFEFSNRYRCIVRGQCNNIISNVVRAFVIIAPLIITQPQNAAICAGGNRTFSIAAQNGTLTYQWQVSTDGGSYFSAISGANQPSLNLTNVTVGMNNNRYRCLILRDQCTTPTISGSAILTVNALPTVSITAAPYAKLLPGLTTTITATGSAAAGSLPFTYRWRLNNGILATVTGNTYIADISKLGDYKVEVIDAKGCIGQSSVLTIGDSVSNKFYILPNPNNGEFTISFYNPAGSIVERQVTIYNATGGTILSDKASVSGAYQIMYYNINPAARGMYFIVLRDGEGKIIAKGKMMVH